MSRSDKTTKYLKECMADALIKLMNEKSIEKISVPEIVETAGVGRATWFRNFSSKSEAITFKIVQLWERWAKEHNVAQHKRFTLDNAKDFFQYNYTIRNIHSVIYKADLQSTLYDAFYQIVKPQYGTDVKDCYKSRLYLYGLFGLLDEWIKRDYYESPEEMTNLFKLIIAGEPNQPYEAL